jgi:alanine dehydrogenase
MLVGVPKEIKVHEYRVGLTPSSVREMTASASVRPTTTTGAPGPRSPHRRKTCSGAPT